MTPAEEGRGPVPSDAPEPAGAANPPAEETSSAKSLRNFLAVVLVVVLIISAGAAAYRALAPPHAGDTMTSTHYWVDARSVLAYAVAQNEAGYMLQSSKGIPSGGAYQAADWAVLGNAEGSEANMTVIVFSTANASLSYISSSVAGVKGLPGYTDVSSDLSALQKYGRCYGYGEDVDGIAVVNGFCSKGNVVIRTHLVSGVDFQQLDSDMVGLMQSLYDSLS